MYDEMRQGGRGGKEGEKEGKRAIEEGGGERGMGEKEIGIERGREGERGGKRKRGIKGVMGK